MGVLRGDGKGGDPLIHLDIAPSDTLSAELPFVFGVHESLAIYIQLSDYSEVCVLEIQGRTRIFMNFCTNGF